MDLSILTTKIKKKKNLRARSYKYFTFSGLAQNIKIDFLQMWMRKTTIYSFSRPI